MCVFVFPVCLFVLTPFCILCCEFMYLCVSRLLRKSLFALVSFKVASFVNLVVSICFCREKAGTDAKLVILSFTRFFF